MDQLGQGVMGVWRSQPPSPTTICTTKAGDNWVDSLKQWEHSGSAFSHAEVWPPPPPEVKRCSLRVTGSVGLFLIHQNKKTSVCDVLSHTVITHFYGCDFPLVWSKTQVLWGEYERNLSAVFVLGGGGRQTQENEVRNVGGSALVSGPMRPSGSCTFFRLKPELPVSVHGAEGRGRNRLDVPVKKHTSCT